MIELSRHLAWARRGFVLVAQGAPPGARDALAGRGPVNAKAAGVVSDGIRP